jgi:MerR family copper efflux transcriptional regulator
MDERGTFTIGEASRISGVSAKMIRYYEEIGLLAPVSRAPNGYRAYSAEEVHDLKFIQRARALGFPVARIRDLLALWRNHERSSSDVKKIALQQIAELEKKIAEMEALKRTLQQLADRCHGNSRPECPILDDLAEDRS